MLMQSCKTQRSHWCGLASQIQWRWNKTASEAHIGLNLPANVQALICHEIHSSVSIATLHLCSQLVFNFFLKCFKFKLFCSNNIFWPLSLCKYEGFTVWVSSCRAERCSPPSSWSMFTMIVVMIGSCSYPQLQDADMSYLSQNKSWLQ